MHKSPDELFWQAADRRIGEIEGQLRAIRAICRRSSGAVTLSDPLARERKLRETLRLRRQRVQYFPDAQFIDPAWDMLLLLYAARFDGRSMAIGDLYAAMHIPATTAWRWMERLIGAGLLLRRPDPRDARRSFLTLSEPASARLDDYFDAIDGPTI